MADPLSVTASVITVLATGGACAKGLLSIIQSVRDAPDELIALSNEVNRLNGIIDEARKVCEQLVADDSSTPQFIDNLQQLLSEADRVLKSLNDLISKFKSRGHKIHSVSWLHQKNRPKKYLAAVQNIRASIMALLVSKTTLQTLNINIRVQELQVGLEKISQKIDSPSAAIVNNLIAQQGSPRNLPITNIFNPSQADDDSLPVSNDLCNSYNKPQIHTKREDKPPELALEREGGILPDQATDPAAQSAIRPIARAQASTHFPSKSVVYFRMYKQSNCEGVCECPCHLSSRYRTPLMLRNLMGTLFSGYTGPSLLSPGCEKSTCQNRDRYFQFTYCFPRWFLERAIHFVAVLNYTGTPTFGLQVRRRVGWGGEDGILRFALTGNTVGVKRLLEVGKASMTDVDPNHGRTALHYAVQTNRIETCEYLLNMGADSHAQDDYGISSYQRAWEQIFTKYGTVESLQALQRLFPKTGISETWEFSPLHEIVLGTLPMPLENILRDRKYREQVNLRDYKGRTPLHWAAITGDVFAVSHLLDNDADVNAQDEDKATPLILGASSGSIRTLELLLLAGANVGLTDIRGGHALHYVTRHQKDVAPVKLLLQAGAAVNCRNVHGHTPFTGAAIRNRYKIGAYLLEHGADMHNGGNNNDTPLFESIFHNSHEFLQLLLREGAKHVHVNKSGSTILHAAALEADVQTINILADSRPGSLDIDLLDKNGKTALEISRQRVSPPDGFHEVFERFLVSVKERSHDVLSG